MDVRMGGSGNEMGDGETRLNMIVMGEVQIRERGNEWMMKELEFCVDSDGGGIQVRGRGNEWVVKECTYCVESNGRGMQVRRRGKEWLIKKMEVLYR